MTSDDGTDDNGRRSLVEKARAVIGDILDDILPARKGQGDPQSDQPPQKHTVACLATAMTDYPTLREIAARFRFSERKLRRIIRQ